MSSHGYSDEERRQYAEETQAEFDLAIETFLGQLCGETFTPDDLADAVQLPKFDVVAAVHWLRQAREEGRVAPGGGGWRVTSGPADHPTFHVRVAPTSARDHLSGPIYAFDLTEAEVVERLIGPYQEKRPISHGGRVLDSYRRPRVTRLIGSGKNVVDKISSRLATSGRVHAPNEAEELFFNKASQDVTGTYISPSEPDTVSATSMSHSAKPDPVEEKDRSIFVVHGHGRKDEVARFLQKITKKEPIVLSELPGRGKTIIEKFEKNASGASYAVVLLTADDVGAQKGKEDRLRPRARQNVILELGYFIGKIGRENVAVLYEDEVELPSDYKGVEYISFADGWKLKLMAKLGDAGFDVSAASV